jgi:hypothetical protein
MVRDELDAASAPDPQLLLDRHFSDITRRLRLSLHAAEKRAGSGAKVEIDRSVKIAARALDLALDEILPADRSYDAVFGREVEDVWGGSFRWIDGSRLLGLQLNRQVLAQRADRRDEARVTAVARVHAWGLLCASDVMVLLRTGSSVGAFARWRSSTRRPSSPGCSALAAW